MLKKWVSIGLWSGVAFFCFMIYYCLQSSLIKTSSSRTEDHIIKILLDHTYTKLQYYKKNSGSCVAVDDTIYVNCVSVFCDRCFVNKKWIGICNHHDVKCYKFVKYIPCHLGEKILLMYITYIYRIEVYS